MNAKDILTIASDIGIQVTLAEVEAELATFDRSTLIAGHKGRIAVEPWNGQDPVNGISAEQIKLSENLPEIAKGYWIFVDGRPRYFQTASPFAGERVMTDPMPVAERHKQALAEEFADQEVLQTIIVRLREKADTRLQAMEDGLLALMLGGAN